MRRTTSSNFLFTECHEIGRASVALPIRSLPAGTAIAPSPVYRLVRWRKDERLESLTLRSGYELDGGSCRAAGGGGEALVSLPKSVFTTSMHEPRNVVTSLWVAETVADVAVRQQVHRMSGVVFQLATQLTDICAEVFPLSPILGTPYERQQPLMS